MIDYIAGQEKNAAYNLLPYKALPPASMAQLKTYGKLGGAMLLSGSYLGTDTKSEEERLFMDEMLGVRAPGRVANDTLEGVWGMNTPIELYNLPNATHYFVQHTDVLEPTKSTAFSVFSYGKGGFSAGVANAEDMQRSITLGFPFECIKDETLRKYVMQGALKYLLKK